MNQLLLLAIQEAPAIIAQLKAAFQKQNPGAPVPTDQEVIDAYNQAFLSSLAKDANWLAQHPEGSQ